MERVDRKQPTQEEMLFIFEKSADLGKTPEVWIPGDAEQVPDKAQNKLIGEWWEELIGEWSSGKPDDDDIKLVKVTVATKPNGLGGANSTTTAPPIFFANDDRKTATAQLDDIAD